MNLLSLLEHLEYKCLQGSTEQEVSSVVYDSRKVEEGSLFICIRGAVVDGHKFIPDVVAKGAKTLIVEEAVEAPEDVTVIQVEDTRYAMAFIQQHGSDIRQKSSKPSVSPEPKEKQLQPIW